MLNIRGLVERGESFYNPYLNDVVAALESQGLAVESEGTVAVFLDGVSFESWSRLVFSAFTHLCVCALVYVTVQEQGWDPASNDRS